MNTSDTSQTVAVLGASTKPDRYSYKAVEMLLEKGHRVLPISPTAPEVLGQPAFAQFEDLDEPVDTLTLYVNPVRLQPLLAQILAAPPRRVIFNPGTESADAQAKLEAAGIETLEACTLVLLGTGQF